MSTSEEKRVVRALDMTDSGVINTDAFATMLQESGPVPGPVSTQQETGKRAVTLGEFVRSEDRDKKAKRNQVTNTLFANWA